MRTMAGVSGVSVAHVGPELIARLEAIWRSAGRPGEDYSTGPLPIDDSRLEQVRECLAAAGLKPVRSKPDRDHSSEYIFGAEREYEQADLDECELCCLDFLHAKRRISCAGRNPLGHMALHARSLPKRAEPRIYVNDWGYVVPHPVKALLESTRLSRVAFRPTVLTGSDYTDGPYVAWSSDPWWELTSDLWMAELAPSNDLRWVGDDRPLDEVARRTKNYGRGIRLQEGFYRRPELRYGKTQLARMLPLSRWDAARTYETFGHWPDSDRRYLIASRRLVRLCLEHDLGGDWVPVRVTEE